MADGVRFSSKAVALLVLTLFSSLLVLLHSWLLFQNNLAGFLLGTGNYETPTTSFTGTTINTSNHQTVMTPTINGRDLLQPVRQPSDFPISICIIVRTYYGQATALPSLLDSILVEQYTQETKLENLTTTAFVVDNMLAKHHPNLTRTDPHMQSFPTWMKELQLRANARVGREAVHLLDTGDLMPDPLSYGYDLTNFALDYVIRNNETHYCTHYMFTNGDNYYLPSLWTELQGLLQTNDLIGWDFLTHHPRKRSNVIKFQWKYRFTDLATFVVKASYIGNLRFRLEEFAADWYFAEQLTVVVPGNRTARIGLVRMTHN